MDGRNNAYASLVQCLECSASRILSMIAAYLDDFSPSGDGKTITMPHRSLPGKKRGYHWLSDTLDRRRSRETGPKIANRLLVAPVFPRHRAAVLNS
jgi:hypothetical protein